MNPGIIPDAKERLGRASLAMGESPAKGLLAIRGLMHSEERLGRALSLPVMFTWAGAAFSLSGALAFLLGIYSGSLSLSCAGSAALLAAYFSWREPADCVAKCAAPLKTSFGAAVPLSYCLSSKGRMVRIRGAELQVASYSIRGNSASAEGIWRPPCPGKLPMPNVLAVVTDRHGLFEKETTCRPDGEMLVLPRKEHRMNLEKKVMKRQIGIRSSKILGGTDEFVSLREYREGDDVRGIDWKATARTGEYCVREMVGFRRDKVLIIADMGKKPLDGNFAGRLVEDALEIGMNHLKLRDSVGLLVSGEKTDLLLLSSSQAQFSLMGYAFAKHNFSGEFNLLSAAKFASSAARVE